MLFRSDDSLAGRVNWWVHMVIILTFLGLIPNSKHLHLLLSPLTVFFKSPELGTVPPLDFEKEQVGLETVKDLPKKAVLDAMKGKGAADWAQPSAEPTALQTYGQYSVQLRTYAGEMLAWYVGSTEADV